MNIKRIVKIVILFLLLVSCSSQDDLYIRVSNSNIIVDNEGAVIIIEVSSNTDWVVSEVPSWCKVDKLNGTNDENITITVGVNSDEKERVAKILVHDGINFEVIEVTQNNSGISEKYEIPVIFHVLYDDKSDRNQYVDEDHLPMLLDRTTELFNDKIDMGLSFIAATKDPNGKVLSEPGVNRIKVANGAYDYEDFMGLGELNTFGIETLWNLNEYINIFIYDLKDKDTDVVVLGGSHLPYAIKNKPLAGLKDGSVYIEVEKPASYAHCISLNNEFIYDYDKNSTSDFIVTLTHELGHYLGLFHAFSTTDETTDYCEDTPNYDRNDYEDWLAGIESGLSFEDLAQRITLDGAKFTSTNIMDYYFSYNTDFTKDQRDRVRHVLMYSPMIPGPKNRGISRSGSSVIPPMRFVE